MLPSLLLMVVTVAFPQEGQRLPALDRCYLIGAYDGAEARLSCSNRSNASGTAGSVSVTRTGAWGTLVDVVPGENVVQIGDCRRTFYVGQKPPLESQVAAAPAKTYGKLEYAADTARPHPSAGDPAKVTIVLDAGHGGSDSGAISPHGLPEKDANLRMATAVRQQLEQRGYRVVLTRADDSFPALYDRPKTAHAERADAFVSIHYNAPGYGTDPTLTRYQAVYAWNPIGKSLAQAISRRMAAANKAVPSKGVLHANFAVTRNPEIPSCLVEVDFVTHPEGEQAAWDADRRGTIAWSIAAGVADWVEAAK